VKTRALLIAMILLSVFAWQCEENPLEPPTQHEILIRSNGFSPSSLTISRGESVLWRNVDGQTHSVDPGTFMNPTQDFSASPNLRPDETFTLTFTQTGTISYYCSIHQQNPKQGTITIRN